SLGIPRMRVASLEHDRHRVRREALDLELPSASAVHRVRVPRAKARDIEVLRAGTDLLVRRKRNSDLTVQHLWMRHQVLGRRDDLGDAGLVVSPEQRLPGRGHDVMADLIAKLWVIREP